jgi:hypothetical protein
MICNPIGILNTYVGISIPYPERKDVGNDKNGIWERVANVLPRLLPKVGLRLRYAALTEGGYAHA